MRRFLQVPVPTADQLEDFVGIDDLTMKEFFWALVILALAFLLSRLLPRLLRRVFKRVPQMSEEVSQIIARASGWVVLVLGFIYALVVIGIDMGPALMVMIVVAVIFFFAGRGMMENFSAGLILQSAPWFAAGDQVIAGDAAGTVKEVSGRAVVIASVDGKETYIPNRIVIGDAVTNLTHLGSRRYTLEVGVAYGTDLDAAKRVLEAAAADCDEALPDPAPCALFTSFGDNTINFKLLFWHGPTISEELDAIDAVGRSVVRQFDEHDIEIAFPQRTLWWGDPELKGTDGSPSAATE